MLRQRITQVVFIIYIKDTVNHGAGGPDRTMVPLAQACLFVSESRWPHEGRLTANPTRFCFSGARMRTASGLSADPCLFRLFHLLEVRAARRGRGISD